MWSQISALYEAITRTSKGQVLVETVYDDYLWFLSDTSAIKKKAILEQTRLGVAQIIQSSKALPFKNTTAVKCDKDEVNSSGFQIMWL